MKSQENKTRKKGFFNEFRDFVLTKHVLNLIVVVVDVDVAIPCGIVIVFIIVVVVVSEGMATRCVICA